MRAAHVTLTVLVATACMLAFSDASGESIAWTLMPEWAPPAAASWPGAADLDGDGDPDLLAGMSCDGLRNDGGCLVGPWGETPSWCDGLPDAGDCVHARVELADLDQDGDTDALFGCYYGSILFFENVGTPHEPQWNRNDDYFYTSWSNFRAPGAADLDGDGDLDIVAGVSAGLSHLVVYWNIGIPAAPVWIEDRDFFSSIAPLGTSVEPNFADIDQDGDLDLVAFPIGWDDVPPNVYENIGTAASALWQTNPGLLSGIDAVHSYHGGVLTDLDCDARPDLLMFVIDDGEYEARCYRNDGPMTAVEQTSWGLIKSLYR